MRSAPELIILDDLADRPPLTHEQRKSLMRWHTEPGHLPFGYVKPHL